MKKSKIAAIVPARMGSSRFPGKPLARILDLPMIEHVRRRAALCQLVDEVYVATCDEEIKEVVESYGGRVIMTAATHERCTDRVEEAAAGLGADIIVNVQGDEPLISPEVIGESVRPLIADKKINCTCMVTPVPDLEEFNNINVVKAVLDNQGYIMYFSRSPIPHFKANEKYPLYKQLCVMAFRKDFLRLFSRLPQTTLEKAESVDMLRILEHGYKLRGVITSHMSYGVDIPGDVPRVEEIIKRDKTQQELYSRILKL